MDIEIYGTDGALDTYGNHLYRKEDDGYHTIEIHRNDNLNYPQANRFHHFIEVILGREKPCISLDQVLSVQKILDAIYASAALKREIPIN